jgi:predicted glycosyltransferase
MKRNRSLLIHCQYVYGIGHFVRAIELARSLREEFDVHLVTGGEPVPNFAIPAGIRVTQLPPVYKEEASGRLVSTDPALDIDACLALRAQMLAQIVQACPPDVVVTEHFPFGLLFENEVVDLLRSARLAKPEAMFLCSVRDVIESAHGSGSDERTCALLNAWFDLILVHGVERVIPLRASFPLIDLVTVPLLYTGYVVEPAEPRRPQSGPPLLVGSIGGGRVGQELLSALVAAHRRLAPEWPHELLLFRGAFEGGGGAADAAAAGAPGLQIRPFDRSAYRRALARASGVICLGGYNSVIESLSMKLPVLVYKRQFLGTNREQALRAGLFAQSGLVRTIEQQELEPAALAPAMRSHFAEPPVDASAFDFDGAANACRIIASYRRAA